MTTPGKSCCTPSAGGRTAPPSSLRPAERPTARSPEAGSTEGMVRLDGGSFLMGADGPETRPEDGEGPVRKVTLDPFHIDVCAVTNREFEAFVQATGYRTEAERFGWSYVFYHLVPKKVLKRQKTLSPQGLEWWMAIGDACWKRPEGPGTNIRKRLDHPVVHISWNDAVAYCEWTGKRLPTEAEWEYAARGGLEGKIFPWGDELLPARKHRCNIWQGSFPDRNTAEDGYIGTAPARSFRPNGFGLYNTVGNVWEWTADWFSPGFHRTETRTNPQGPPTGENRLMKGGSYLCHHSYCNRYRVSARNGNTPDSSTGNCGFRCARDA